MDPLDIADDIYEQRQDDDLDRLHQAVVESSKPGDLDLTLPFIPFVFPI